MDLVSHAHVLADSSDALGQLARSSPQALQQLADWTSCWSQQLVADGWNSVETLAQQGRHLHCAATHQDLASLYDLADAALAEMPKDAAATASKTAQRSQDWLSPIAEGLDFILQSLKTGLDKANVPYSYGWSIIGLTIITKILTFPFTKAQVGRKTINVLLRAHEMPFLKRYQTEERL